MDKKLPYRLLVFDWDGTLMDSEARIVGCMTMTFTDLGLEAPPREALLNVIGLGLTEAFLTLMPGADREMVARLGDRYRYHFLSDHQAPANLFDGARETLEDLDRQGYLLGIATGKARRGLNRSLDETGCASLFAVTRCADETASKPDPRMLLEVIDVAGVDPGEVLMIGDTEYDLEMAHNAGVAALAVSYGVHAPERLLARRPPPLTCLDDIRDIVAWLDRAQRRDIE